MSVAEIESAIAQLPVKDFAELIVWIQEYRERARHAQIENDLAAGRLDATKKEVHIIVEVNCYISKPSLFDSFRLSMGLKKAVSCRGFETIWLVFPPNDVGDYETTGFKIIGPLPEEKAESAIVQLQKAFISIGFKVEVETYADD
jgi:hypothetical protein